MRTWVNGALVEPHAAVVSVFDHGLTVGDGVFETAKVVDGSPFALTRHLARLQASARGLGLPEPDLALVRRAVGEVLRDHDRGNHHGRGRAMPLRLRITYTAGVSPLGSDRGDAGPTLVVAAVPLRPWPETAVLATVPWPRNEHAATAGLKTTSYADNVVALARARQRGADEAVLANTAGQLCEGTGSNVFVVLDGQLVTPPLASGCLAGVTRGLVLEWVESHERDLPMSVLGEAAEVFLTSSTRDVQAVRAVDGRILGGAPGPLTRAAAQRFARAARADPDP